MILIYREDLHILSLAQEAYYCTYNLVQTSLNVTNYMLTLCAHVANKGYGELVTSVWVSSSLWTEYNIMLGWLQALC